MPGALQEEVQSVLTSSGVDVLSHVAIRARTQRVLLATCYEEWQLDALRGLVDTAVTLSVDPSGSVNASPLEATSASGALSPSTLQSNEKGCASHHASHMKRMLTRLITSSSMSASCMT